MPRALRRDSPHSRRYRRSYGRIPAVWLLAAGAAAAADTLDLPASRALPPPPAARETLIPSDVDRQLGDLGDLLQRLAGVHVMRAGGLGDYLGVSLRGASESQVGVYVNGVLQNPAADPSLFLSSWDLARVERVEVYQGLAPGDLPGAPLGGAINIVTREAASAGPHARGALGAGSFGSLKANGAAEVKAGRWRARMLAARDQARGDFPYYDDGGLEYEPGRHPEGADRLGPDDLVRKTRRNNAHGLSELAGRLAYAPSPAWEGGVQAEASRLSKQIPAPYAGVDSSVRVDASLASDRTAVGGNLRYARGPAEISLDLSGSWLRQVYLDTSNGIGAVGIGYDNDRNAYLDGRADLRARIAPGSGLELAVLLGYGASAYFYSDRTSGRAYPGVFRYAGEAKLTPTFTRGNHVWQASLDAPVILDEQSAARRYGYGGKAIPAEAWDWRVLARLGYQYRLGEGRWLFVQGGQGARQPTFLEKYGDRGAVLANPSLRAESGWTGSAGARLRSRRWSAEATLFAAAQSRLITLEQNAQNVLTYRNTARARILGMETRLSASPRPWARSEIDLTAQRAASGGTWFGELRIPNRPDFQASLREIVSARGFSLAASAYYQGLAFPNAANLPSLFDSYSHNTRWQARCDLDLSWRYRHLLVAAGARNLFDQRAFDFFNYPLPGRSFAAAVQAEW